MVGAYLVGDPSAADAVLVAADAPGWRAPGVRRFARLLHRASGALVVVPDLARGDTWYGDPDPAKRAREKAFAEWRRGSAPAERVAADAAAVGAALRERGAKRVAAVGVGTGAGAVAALLGKRASDESAGGGGSSGGGGGGGGGGDDASATKETMDAGAVACAVDLDAASAGRAAASGVPVLFVWGGGDGATAARKAAEESAGAAGAHGARWRSVAFGDADEHFAFFRESEVKNDADDADARVVDAANEIVQWMFRE